MKMIKKYFTTVSILLVCFVSLINVSEVHATVTPQPIGTLSGPTFDCSTASNSGGTFSQLIYNAASQSFSSSCSSVYGYPYASLFPDIVTLTTSDSVNIMCRGQVVATFHGPGTFSSAYPNSCPGFANFWPGLIFSMSFVAVAPSNLTAVSPTPTSVNLLWTNNSASVDNINIERSTSGGNFSVIATVAPTATTYTDTNLSPFTSYSYRVAAVSTAGNSGYSNLANITTLAIANLAPSNLTAATTSDSTSINLSWMNNSSTQTGVIIERSDAGGIFVQIATVGSNTTTYTDSYLIKSGTTYQYRVLSQFPDTYSGFSNVASITTNSKVTIIDVGGFTGGLPIYQGISTWMNAIQPDSIYIPMRAHSIATVTNSIISAVNDQLSKGNKVLVIGHSLGSFIVFNLRNYFPSSPVKFIYVDPPYHPGGLLSIVAPVIGSLTNRGSFGSVSSAISAGIATDPNSVIWTNGTAAPFKVHNAFDCQNCANNATNLANLKAKILSVLQSSDWGTSNTQASLGAITNAPTISINGLEDSTGLLISTIHPGDTVSITGTGFDSQANDIEIQNLNDPTVFYDFYDYVPDVNGNLTFTLPQSYDLSDSGGSANTVAGTYSIKVAGLSTDWSNIGTISIEATSTVTPPILNGITPDPTLPNQFQMTGSGFSATGNSVGLTPVTTSMNQQTSNTASVWDAFIQFIKSIFGFNDASAQTVVTPTYVISGLTSDGSNVPFTVPSNVPNGTYTVSVRSLNTGWVTTTYTINVTGNGTGVTGGTIATTTCTTNCGGTTVTTATTTNGTYSCPSGYSISGTNCTNSALTATATVTCPGGYSLSGTTCTLPAVTTSVPASTVAATVNYYCSTGGSVSYGNYLDGLGNWQSGPHCNSNGAIGYSTWYGAGSRQTCPSNASPTYATYSLYNGNYAYVCNIPAHTVTTPAVTSSATVTCPGGYSASGTTCTLPANTIAATLSCGTGYSVYSNSCYINTTPVGLSASASSQTGINLSWTNLSSAGISNISIERSTDGSNFTQVSSVDPSMTSSYSDSGLSIDSTYYYRIRTVLSDGTYGAYSLVVSATTSNLSTPTSLTATATATSTIGLSWSDSDTGITSYTVTEMSPASTTFTTTGKTYTVTDLQPSTKYCFSVSSNVNAQHSSALSSQACATTATPIAPLSVSCSPTPTSIVRSNTASVTWSSVVKGGVTPYHYAWLWPSAGTYSSIGTDSNTYTWGAFNTGYVAGTRVMKLTVTSGSDSITVSCGALILKAAVPTITASANGATGINLSWSDTDTKLNSFVILSSPASTTLVTLGTTTLKYSVTNLLPNTKYCYAVQAIVDPTNTATSLTACATTGSLVAPTSLSSSVLTQGQIKLSWNNNGAVGFTGVDIERSTSKTSGYSSIAIATSTSYLDTGLSSLTTYYYNVRLMYPGGLYSSYTSTSTVTTLKSTTPVNTATTTIPTTSTSTTTNPIPTTTATTTQSITTTIPATVTYTCLTGTLSGTNCTVTTSAGIRAISTNVCPTNYTKTSSNQCTLQSINTNKRQANISDNAPATITLPIYSCNSSLTLNTLDNLCYSSSKTTTVPATPVYSCPSGYVLNTTNHTCSTVVSTNMSASSTANAWDAVMNWFGELFQ